MRKETRRRVVEDDYLLEVNLLKRAGVLYPGWSGNLRWRRQGQVIAKISLSCEGRDCLRLHYRITDRSRVQVVDRLVGLEWTRCQLGGERPWFLCPFCDSRVATLYGKGMFGCRRCSGLGYSCQQLSKQAVAGKRSTKLRDALGCELGFYFKPAEAIPKPKGMHWSTFDKIIERLKKADQQALMADYEALERAQSR